MVNNFDFRVGHTIFRKPIIFNRKFHFSHGIHSRNDFILRCKMVLFSILIQNEKDFDFDKQIFRNGYKFQFYRWSYIRVSKNRRINAEVESLTHKSIWKTSISSSFEQFEVGSKLQSDT